VFYKIKGNTEIVKATAIPVVWQSTGFWRIKGTKAQMKGASNSERLVFRMGIRKCAS
jgi:hypothetical protein